MTINMAGLASKLERLVAKDEIRDCLYRINRGMDRIDRDLMLSGFHDDAQVCWAAPDFVPLHEFIEVAMMMQGKTSRVQHLLGNILIDLHDGYANVESCEMGRHLTQTPDGEKDLFIAARYIDKFSRRENGWRIERRQKLVDSIRVVEGVDNKYDNVPHKGIRNRGDPSYELFGTASFGA